MAYSKAYEEYMNMTYIYVHSPQWARNYTYTELTYIYTHHIHNLLINRPLISYASLFICLILLYYKIVTNC